MRRPNVLRVFALLLCAPAFAGLGDRTARADETAALDTDTLSALLADAGPVTTGPSPAPTVSLSYDPGYDSVSDYFTHWFERVDRAQAEQPHWMTPIITVTPRLEEEFRWDQYWQHTATGANIDNYDAGKGLELIPTETEEIILGLPPYVTTGNVPHPASGFADWPFFLFKQRLLTANEENGNYILTLFLSGQAPVGITRYTQNAYVITPTIAGGFGVGDFDLQATVGFPYPTDHIDTLGAQVVTNATLQYHFLTYFWPEFDITDIDFLNGVRGGKNEVFLMPGILFGRFHLYGRLRLVFGFGYQFAVSPHTELDPLTPTYNHAWIFSVRFPC